MSLIESMQEQCVLIERERVADGEGGFTTAYRDGTPFYATIAFNSSMEARSAQKQGVTSLYTVTTNKNAKLDYHDIFRRLSDNKIFRVTSDGDDISTPKIASFQFLQVQAEEWSLS